MTLVAIAGTSALLLAGAAGLFLLGLRLSAFFSGCETGFYRASFLRLTIDAHAGDRVAARLLWFAHNPGYFVATTLVGNNVANYLATFAIGLATAALYPEHTGWVEVIGTLLMAPVIFVLGELLPKNLYYRAPLYLLRRDFPWFVMSYRLFRPASLPLVWITKLFERFGGSSEAHLEMVLGRSRLVQVLSRGHQEGLLTDVQSRLVHGLLHTAGRPVTESMIPISRVLGVTDAFSRDELLAYAKQFGMAKVPVRRHGAADAWFGYLRVADVAISRLPLASLINPMPRIDAALGKLEALLTLRNENASYGLVHRDDRVVGIVAEHGLVEQLFRAPPVSS
jgi:CBS domain containing-hemolysin-like protein